MNFARSMSLTDALAPDAILAYDVVEGASRSSAPRRATAPRSKRVEVQGNTGAWRPARLDANPASARPHESPAGLHAADPSVTDESKKRRTPEAWTPESRIMIAR
jgi:hypothetical protein